VSQSWFCKWKDGRLPPAVRRERLKAGVARRFAGRGGRDGSPRITAALRDAGWRVSENTVAGLMRGQRLAARRKKKRKAGTRPGRGRWRAPDQVRRKFAAGGINRRWYGDGTEIATAEGRLYLDRVLDMGSRRILGFALGARHDAELAYGALTMAVAVQGSEYTSAQFRQACERLGICQSMGPGSAPGNAVIESWHSALESGLQSLRTFATRAAAGRGRGVDRGLQPRPPALRPRHEVPSGLRAVAGGKGRRVSAAGPLRGPGKGGGCAAAVLLVPLRVRGRPSALQGAAHRPGP
jgi:putative transposase